MKSEQIFQMSASNYLICFREHQVNRPILISDDRHISELSKLVWEGKLIYEITLSGMKMSKMNLIAIELGKLIGQKSFARLDVNWALMEIQVRLTGDQGYLWDEIKLDF